MSEQQQTHQQQKRRKTRSLEKYIDELNKYKYDIIIPHGKRFQFTPLMLEEIDAATKRIAAVNESAERELQNAFRGYETI